MMPIGEEEMSASASDLDEIAVRNPFSDDHYINTPWSHDPEGDNRVPTSRRNPLVPESVLSNLYTLSTKPGDGPRPLALGLSARDAQNLDFDTLRAHMCFGCFNVSGMRTKRELLYVLEAERSAGVLC